MSTTRLELAALRSLGEEGELRGQGSVPGGGAYTLVVEEDRFDPGRPTDFRFKVLGPDGQAVTDSRPLHERDLHLIVVRRDLATFSHLHPTREPDGTWHVELDPALPPARIGPSSTSPPGMARR